jgi:NhaA family Na+:H+ antiporter
MGANLVRLPAEPVDRFTRPFSRVLRIEAAAGAVLLLFALGAVALANSPWSVSFQSIWEVPIGLRLGTVEFSRSLKHWISDGLMTFFFFVVALELKREIIVGELQNPRIAALSFAAALGGMALPASVYAVLASADAGGPHGWGTVMATDTAFVVGCLAVLGSRIPHSLRLFLLSLAIFDDLGAIVVVAVGYGDTLNGWALALAAAGLLLVLGMARIGVRIIPPFFLVGALVWLALDASGMHPTLAGILLGLMTPARGWVSDNRLHAILNRVIAYPPGDHWSGDTSARHDLRRAGIATREALSPLERLEMLLHPWVAFAIMPLFAFANAGVPLLPERFDATIAAAIFAAFVLGKPVGVLLFSVLAVRLGFAVLPAGLSWSLLGAGGLLTGMGFTMALFIAGLAFGPDLLDSAKIAILGASVVSGAAGLLVLTWLTRRKAARPRAYKARGRR